MRRLNIRIDEETYAQLRELREVMGFQSVSSTLRNLVRSNHRAWATEVRQLKRLQERAAKPRTLKKAKRR